MKVVTNWDKLVFYSSMVGLLFLLGFTFYKNTYLKKLENTVEDKRALYEENKTLKEENERLLQKINTLENKVLQYEQTENND